MRKTTSKDKKGVWIPISHCPAVYTGVPRNTCCRCRVGAAVWVLQPWDVLGDADVRLFAAASHSARTAQSWAAKGREGDRPRDAQLCEISACHHLCLPAGVRMGSLGLFLQCVTSIFFSTIMDRLVKQFGTRTVYLASVVFFPAAAFVMCLSHSVIVVTVSAALTGFTFSALQILPYTLASLYHHEKQVGQRAWEL